MKQALQTPPFLCSLGNGIEGLLSGRLFMVCIAIGLLSLISIIFSSPFGLVRAFAEPMSSSSDGLSGSTQVLHTSQAYFRGITESLTFADTSGGGNGKSY